MRVTTPRKPREQMKPTYKINMRIYKPTGNVDRTYTLQQYKRWRRYYQEQGLKVRKI